MGGSQYCCSFYLILSKYVYTYILSQKLSRDIFWNLYIHSYAYDLTLVEGGHRNPFIYHHKLTRQWSIGIPSYNSQRSINMHDVIFEDNYKAKNEETKELTPEANI